MAKKKRTKTKKNKEKKEPLNNKARERERNESDSESEGRETERDTYKTEFYYTDNEGDTEGKSRVWLLGPMWIYHFGD